MSIFYNFIPNVFSFDFNRYCRIFTIYWPPLFIINIFVYPLMALLVIYFYLDSRQQAGESLAEIVTSYQESYPEK